MTTSLRVVLFLLITGVSSSGCQKEASPSGAGGEPGGGPGAATPSGAAPASGAAPGVEKASASLRLGEQKTLRAPSGLEFAVLKEGSGASPPLGSMVKVHCTGWLPDGKVFIDTRTHNVPKEYRLARAEMIDGWVEALLTMKPGEKRKLRVPKELAYSKQGFPKVVPPNSDLDFEIELVSFTPPGSP
ncbi:MAG TPA: FKBP-type peptidyl-prolyl cis-trans isomerase [Planctomycetota bacterium]|nr:FKBP-type peptidyl-prolyl cis-trans isomerase [Planctomycetota bacterium]